MTWWMRFDQILNSRRLTYAWIAGGILWGAWLLSTFLGQGTMDLANQVIGTDYLQFYAAGVTLREGHSLDLYNFEYQSKLEQAIIGPGLPSFYAFLTPPFLAWLYVPFSYLPYVWSFIAWSILGLLFIWISLRLLMHSQPLRGFVWTLTWFPIFASVSFGQNSLLSLLLFSLTFWLWKKEKYLAAGVVSSLLLFKPQMVLGIVLLWLLEWRLSWKSLLGMLLGGGILAGLCFWLLPDASLAYIRIVRDFLPTMIYQEQFPLWHMHSLRGFWALLFPGNTWLVEGLSLLLSVAGVIGFIYFWRSQRLNKSILFAGAICLTIWITPHAMIYDWSILLIPAILIWQEVAELKSLWKSLFALIWVGTFLSGALTVLQLKVLPIAIQISIPIFLFTVIAGATFLLKRETKAAVPIP